MRKFDASFVFVALGAFSLAGCSPESEVPHTAPDSGQRDASLDRDDCLPRPCPSGAPFSRETCSCRPDCNLDGQVAQRAGGAETVDCGKLEIAADQAAREQAQLCVLAAVASNMPFRLVLWLQGTDSGVAIAYVSPGAGQPVSILYYDSDPSGGSGVGAVVDEQTCSSLQVQAGCNVGQETLCLECPAELERGVACDARFSQSEAECRGAGNYEVGKEGGYQPCCGGLRQVYQKKPAYTGDNSDQKVCTDPPLNVYACVEGRCGDGHCEDPEAVACGCALDCPSAVWGP